MIELPLKSRAVPSSLSSSNGRKKRTSKTHVPTACVNCKKSHLACDLARPCRRCVSMDKTDTCVDIQHKKRGRPKIRDKRRVHPKQEVPGLRSLQSSMVMTRIASLGVTDSSFALTRIAGFEELDASVTADPSLLTILLSMDLACARVSDESLPFLGIHPQKLAHRSFYDLIMSDSVTSVTSIHQRLADSINSDDTVNKPAILDHFVRLSPSILIVIANGSQTLKDTLHFKHNDGSPRLLDAHFYLGGGLGADLCSPDTIHHSYIVCLLTRHINDDPYLSLSQPATTLPPALSSCSPSVSSPSSLATTSPTTAVSQPSHSALATIGTPPSTLHPDDQGTCSDAETVSDLYLKPIVLTSSPTEQTTHPPSVSEEIRIITLTDPWANTLPERPSPSLSLSSFLSLPLPQVNTLTTDMGESQPSIIDGTYPKLIQDVLSDMITTTLTGVPTASPAASPKELDSPIWMHPHDTFFSIPSVSQPPATSHQPTTLTDPTQLCIAYGSQHVI